jgi:hypothetical protein
MNRLGIATFALIACAVLLTAGCALAAGAGAQEPAPVEVNKELIDTALKLTKEGAAKYAITLEDGAKLKLVSDPVLRWSNPSVGEIHGNVFLWTAGDRPAVVGSFYKWFTPHTHLSHEFHSLAVQPLVASSGEADVWTTKQAGVSFKPLADAPAPAPTAAGRLLQMKRLAKDFAATKIERHGSKQEMRLLPQPIYRYAAPEARVLDGALFVLVQGTDPEVFLLLEARGEKGKETWSYAPTRMNGVGFSLRYQDKEVWSVEIMPWKDITSHAETYTTFQFNMP